MWAAVAVLMGVLAATQPLPVTSLAGVLVVLVLLAAITPLAAMSSLLILAPLRTLIATEAPLKLPLDIGQISFIALLATWIMYRVSRGLPLVVWRWSPVSTAITLFLAVTGLTVFSATSLVSWLNEWLKWAIMLILITLALDLGRGGRWRWLLLALILAGVANALVGLYQFVGGSGALHLLINARFFRAFGTFGQPNPFGGFMGLLAPLALMAAFGYGVRTWQLRRTTGAWPRTTLLLAVFYSMGGAVLVIGLGISWSRGAWLGFAVSLLVIVLALPRRLVYGLMAITISIAILGTLWFAGLLPQAIIQRISSSTEEYFVFSDVRGVDISPENYALTERLAHWQAALNMARENPWLGVGFGNFEIAYPYYRLINWPEPLGHAHNYYLNILAEGGIIGLLGYGKAWVLIIGVNWRTRRHPNVLARCVAVGLLGAWSYLSAHLFFDNLFVNNLFIHLGLMLGILAALHDETRTAKAKLGAV